MFHDKRFPGSVCIIFCSLSIAFVSFVSMTMATQIQRSLNRRCRVLRIINTDSASNPTCSPCLRIQRLLPILLHITCLVLATQLIYGDASAMSSHTSNENCERPPSEHGENVNSPVNPVKFPSVRSMTVNPRLPASLVIGWTWRIRAWVSRIHRIAAI